MKLDNINYSVWDSVRESSVRILVWPVCRSVQDSVWTSVADPVGNSVWSSALVPVKYYVHDSVDKRGI